MKRKNESLRLKCVKKALKNAGNASSIDEAIDIFEKEIGVHEALERVKKMTDIKTASIVLQAKVGGRNRLRNGSHNSDFSPEEGDIVRGACESFANDYVPGFGEVNVQRLAEALGRKERSVLMAQNWNVGLNQDRLTRKVPGLSETVRILQAIAG